jgi:hypothetical protein
LFTGPKPIRDDRLVMLARDHTSNKGESVGRIGVLALVAALAAAVVTFVGAGAAFATATAGTAVVTNANDSGPGSFRDAVRRANTDTSVRLIAFRPGLAPINLADPVVYTGSQALDIVGAGATLDGRSLDAGDADAFLANGGGDLSVSLLTVRNAPRQGLTYQVPTEATGVKRVRLTGVRIVANRGHGVLVNDQTNPADTADATGSSASLDVSVVGSRFEGNGFGALDQDGLRVNEGGAGALRAVIALTSVEANGGDGIELDERADGDAAFNVSATAIARNGNFDVATDPDDGMDVDESGDGAVLGKVQASSASDNFEEGFDINENDAGDFRVDMTLVDASRNVEEGIDFEEDDDFAGGGDLVTTLLAIKADSNRGGDAGLKIREKGDGNLDATVRGVQANGNSTGGISVREDAAGNLVSTVDRPTTRGNAGHGIDFDENRASAADAGNLTAEVSRGASTDNGGAGVRADQQTPGVGTLSLVAMVLAPNAGGEIIAGNVTVSRTP